MCTIIQEPQIGPKVDNDMTLIKLVLSEHLLNTR
jgi:hypothetical protein